MLSITLSSLFIKLTMCLSDTFRYLYSMSPRHSPCKAWIVKTGFVSFSLIPQGGMQDLHAVFLPRRRTFLRHPLRFSAHVPGISGVCLWDQTACNGYPSDIIVPSYPSRYLKYGCTPAWIHYHRHMFSRDQSPHIHVNPPL